MLCLQGLWRIPSSISFQKAAALAVSYGTAYVGLTNKANTQPGYDFVIFGYVIHFRKYLIAFKDFRKQ